MFDEREKTAMKEYMSGFEMVMQTMAELDGVWTSAAKCSKKFFDALVAEGFTEEQATRIAAGQQVGAGGGSK